MNVNLYKYYFNNNTISCKKNRTTDKMNQALRCLNVEQNTTKKTSLLLT